MRHLKLLFMLLVSFFGIQSSHGAVLAALATDNYYCGFKTENEFKLWTVLMLDNDDNVRTWNYAMNGIAESVTCTCNLGSASNDWLITPLLTLTQGKQHFIKIKYTTSAPGQKIIFTMGRDKTAESQNVVLLDSTFNGPGYLTIKVPESSSGDYYFALNYRAGAWTGNFTLFSFYLTESEGVVLNGTVKNDRDRILEGAKVSLSSEKYKKNTIDADAAGKFSFKSLDPGEYTLNVSSDGNVTKEEVVTIGTTQLDHPVVLTALTEYDVKGCIKSEEDTPVKSAVVTLQGELTYTTTTDENGNFLIEKAREYKGYKLKVEKDLKVTYTSVVDVNGDEVDLGDIVMQTRVSTPYNVKALETEPGTLLSWMLPLKATEIRYDSGIHSGTASYQGSEYTVTGVLFDTPALLKGMSWMAVSEGKPVNLYVFALNPDGSPSTRILFSVKGVENVDYKYDGNMVWNEYSFPEEIEAPYGCLLALACSDKMAVLYDSGTDPGYPKAYKNYISFDYRNGFINDGSIIGNLLIRLVGSPLGVPQLAPGIDTNVMKSFKDANTTMAKAPATGEVTYKAWRFETKDKDNQEAWTALELSDQKSLSYLDRAYAQLPKGVYQYAVQVIYGDGQESAIGYSNELEHKIYANATFPISTNVGAGYADGAVVKLVDDEDETLTYLATVNQGVAKFEQVRKGSYYLLISKKGFKTKRTDAQDLGLDDNYVSKETFNLELDNRNPFNLKVEQNYMDVTFTWNNEEGINEDFEGMEDFTVNPAGEAGWTYVDADGAETIGVRLCQSTPYPNMFAKMAYMSFNPGKTTPDLLDYLKPHSGDKVLVCPSSVEAQNDDYLFSPVLSFTSDFELSFYAKAGFFALSGQEEFMIGYCKETATPGNVTWITQTPELVGAAWTQFTYDIPKDAKYITIRCVSNEKFFFLLDDLFIGHQKALVDQIANYNVFLDEEPMGKTGNSEMTFANMAKGRHIAKVQSVYTLIDDTKAYSDFVELAFTVLDLTGIEGQTTENLYAYDSQRGVVTFNQAAEINAYNTQGQLVKTTNETQLNVSNWQSGLYIFKVKANNCISHYKIFVK